MKRKYTKVAGITKEVMERKKLGETNRQIAQSYGLTKQQIKQLVSRENRKARRIVAGYIPRPQGRPKKTPESEEQRQANEIARLKMEVELLRNFLYEAGRK